MRQLLTLFCLTGAAGCATPLAGPEPEAAALEAMEEAMRVAPSPQPVPIGPLQPPNRLESEIKAMSGTDLARWMLPPEAASQVASVRLLSGRMPRLTGASLSALPSPTPYPGLCELRGWDVWFRVPNEASLTHQQWLNPPQQPYQYTRFVKWAVAGSTRAGGSVPSDCAAGLASARWFEAPSAAAAYRAVSLIEQAQARPDRVRLTCTQMRYDEARRETIYPACTDARSLLQQLTPKLIKRVRAADCASGPEPGERDCIGIEYEDPASPGTYSFYAVTMPNGPQPRYVRIAQGMMPPH